MAEGVSRSRAPSTPDSARKIAMVQQTFEPGMTVSRLMSARLRRQRQPALQMAQTISRKALSRRSPAGEDVVQPQSWLLPSKQIRELQRLLRKKTTENGSSKTVEVGRAKNGLRMRPCCRGRRLGRWAKPMVYRVRNYPFIFPSKTWLARWPAASPTR